MSNKKKASWAVICSRELSALFTSPIPYIVCVVFLLVAGIMFFATFFLIKRAELRGFFEYLPRLFSLFIPALTMRVFSEEKRSGSLETLLTLPVTPLSVVAGKYLASLVSCVMLLVPTLFYVLTCCLLGEVDSGPIIGGYIGAILLAASYCAVGVFSSSVTKNQIVSFFISFAICAFLSFCGMFAVLMPSSLVRGIKFLSSTSHFESIARGIIDSRDIIYFLSITALFFALTVASITNSKKKIPVLDMVLFAAILLMLNLVGGKAFVRGDLTEAKSYSLSPASRDVCATLEQPLQIKVFFSENLPADQNAVRQYVQDMLTEYKNASGKKLTVEYFDTEKDENASMAGGYGLQQVQIQEIKNNEVGFKNVFMGLVFTYADQIECLDPVTQASGLEYKITTSISRLIRNTNILAGMKETPKLTLYKSSNLLNFEISGMDKVDQIVKNAYELVNKKANGLIEFQSIDPSGDECLSLRERYGIQVIRTKDENRSESLAALGLVLQKGESFRVVPLQMVSMQVMPGVVLNAVQGLEELEENISGALESLVAQTQTIAYVTGHGCLDMNDPQYGAGNFASLLRDGYTLQELNLATKDIPSDVACIMINGPKEEFSQAELYKIDQFMMRGGNVMLFLDPFVEQYPQDPNNPYAQVKYYANKTGLEQILSKNGIEVKPNYVLDSQCFKRPMQGLGNVNFYHAPIVQKENLAKDNPVTYNLGFLVFLQAGEITSAEVASSEVASGEVADLEFTKLASASKKSWTVTADENDEVMIDPRFIVPPTEGVGEHTLALLAQGKFTSCFTGPLADSANAENESALEGNNFIAKGTQKGKLFVASTSQITGPNIISENSGEPIALFLENVVDYMNGKEDLCSMRTKGLSLNPLHVTSGPVANFAKYFNEAGLAVLVALAGLIVFLLRKRRRNSIRKEFSSEVEKNE